MAHKLSSYINDFSGWYQDVVQYANLAENSPVRGCMVIKPYGYELWEAIKSGLDRRFKETGHVNAYFPLFIPLHLLEKEAQHVEGFAKECAVVTHHRLEKGPDGKLIPAGPLAEPLIVRPTSETIIGEMYSKWVQSHRDLPILMNQWANVVRWELRTRMFLRTTEFLWQEGHTAHTTYEEAQAETLRMLDVYTDFAVNDAALPVVRGVKTRTETFPGAIKSYTIEAMMGDKRALQSGTSHNLGQTFAKASNIRYLDENNERQYCWTTSWGVSTRMVGAIIMAHGDEKGLRLPPVLAPIQVVIIPIGQESSENVSVMQLAQALNEELKRVGIRSHLDSRPELRPGQKFNEWELKGVPLRVDIGPQEAISGQLSIARRDKPAGQGRQKLSRDNAVGEIRKLLSEIQHSLFAQAKEFRDANVHEPSDYASFKEVVNAGWAFAWWCGDAACEAAIKDDTTATARCIPLEGEWTPEGGPHTCIHCGKQGTNKVYFAKAY